MTATDTEAALLAAVRAKPGDNVLRGAYADCLKEHGQILDGLMQNIIAQPGEDRWRLDYAAELERMAGEAECGCDDGSQDTGGFTPWGEPISARCNICDGTSRVSDERAELAAFVRVQVELAARDDERCRCRECQPTGQHHNGPCRSPLKPLRRRERELWPAVQGHFLPRDGLKWLPMLDGRDSQLLIDARTQMPLVLIRRGLPSVVRCTLAEWMGGEECHRCRGGGKIWAAWSVKHESAIYPGRKRVDCPACRGEGRTPAIGPRLAQRWPVVAVEVTDKLPLEIARGVWRWGKRVSLANGPYGLDDPIYSMARGDHPTESAARAALSDALIAWARGQSV